MATITKRGDKQWQAKVRKKGYPVQTKTFPTKAMAEQWSRLAESEMDRGVFVSTTISEQTTLDDLFQRYTQEILPSKKAQADAMSRMKVISGYLGFYTVAALTAKLLAEYRDERLKSIQAASICKELHLIGRILNHAQREWEIALPRGNPVETIAIPSSPKGRDRRLHPGEEELLKKAAIEYGGEIGAIIGFAVETAMRRGEIAGLRWNDINLMKRTATLWDTKNGDSRVVPLSTVAIQILNELTRHISGKVFTMRPDSITQAFDRICSRLQIGDLRFHDLRHEATSRLFERGLSIMEVSAVTGHKDLVMLKRYTHLKAEDLAKKLG